MNQPDFGRSRRATTAILAGRFILAAVFALGLIFKLIDPAATASYIGAAGFPLASLLAWLAIAFEAMLVVSFVSGIAYRTSAVAAAAYVLFLGFAFHGPGRWAASQDEFGFFIDHFPFVAALLLAFASGPGDWLIGRKTDGRP